MRGGVVGIGNLVDPDKESIKYVDYDGSTVIFDLMGKHTEARSAKAPPGYPVGGMEERHVDMLATR